MGKHAYAAGHFTCADCFMFEAKLAVVSGGCDKALRLSHRLVQLRASAVADSSEATYASGLHRFVQFGVTQLRLQPWELLPRPVTACVNKQHLLLFLAYAESRYKATTIESTLTALVSWHRSKGLLQAGQAIVRDQEVRSVLRRVKVAQGPAGVPQGKAGMSKDVLRLLLAMLEDRCRSASDHVFKPLYMRDSAFLLLGFFGLLRRSELIALQLKDIAFSDEHVRVTIRRSKCDQRGHGVTVLLAPSNGAGKHLIRIRSTLHRWYGYRVEQGAGAGDPLLPAWDLVALNTHVHRPLRNGQALSDRLRQYLQDLKRTAPDLQINHLVYGMHSLRRGGTVAAWEAGVNMQLLMAHGRWRSDAVRAYLQATQKQKLSVTTAM